MIIKMDGVTAAQLHKLQKFIDGDDNLFVLDSKSAQVKKGKDLKEEDLQGKEHFVWYHPVKLLKAEGKTDGRKGNKINYMETSFNIALEINERIGIEATPRVIVDQVWQALDRFPVEERALSFREVSMGG